jgi:hypothetical protein
LTKSPCKARQVHNGVTISCQTRPFATKFFFDSIKWVSLVLSADGNTIIFWPFWSSCMHKCIPLLDLRFLCVDYCFEEANIDVCMLPMFGWDKVLVHATGSKQDEVWRLNAFIFSAHTGPTQALRTTLGESMYLDRWNSKMDHYKIIT